MCLCSIKRFPSIVTINWVLNHGSQAEKELKEKQVHVDVPHVMKDLISESPVTLSLQWVEGHPAKINKLRNCTHTHRDHELYG